MISEETEILAWFTTIVNLVAIWFVSSRDLRGLWIGLLSNLLWALYGYFTTQWSFVLLNVIIAVINLRGIRYWRKLQ